MIFLFLARNVCTNSAKYLKNEEDIADYFALCMEEAGDDAATCHLERGVVRVAMSLTEQVSAVRALFKRYDNAPASLADACLVRMSELHDLCRVLTLDSDFTVYRCHGRKVIPVLMPF